MPRKSARPSKRAAPSRAKRKPKVTLPAPRARTVNHRLPPGICRVDQASTRTYGYVVRVGHRASANGWRPRFTAYFGDFSHGGKKEALAAAERWLKVLERTGKPPKKK